jgi:hypothetical protein
VCADSVPLQAIAAYDVLKPRIVAGLDKAKLAFLGVIRGSRLRPFPTAEMALKTGIGGNMGYEDPGTPPGRRLGGLD